MASILGKLFDFPDNHSPTWGEMYAKCFTHSQNTKFINTLCTLYKDHEIMGKDKSQLDNFDKRCLALFQNPNFKYWIFQKAKLPHSEKEFEQWLHSVHQEKTPKAFDEIMLDRNIELQYIKTQKDFLDFISYNSAFEGYVKLEMNVGGKQVKHLDSGVYQKLASHEQCFIKKSDANPGDDLAEVMMSTLATVCTPPDTINGIAECVFVKSKEGEQFVKSTWADGFQSFADLTTGKRGFKIASEVTTGRKEALMENENSNDTPKKNILIDTQKKELAAILVQNLWRHNYDCQFGNMGIDANGKIINIDHGWGLYNICKPSEEKVHLTKSKKIYSERRKPKPTNHFTDYPDIIYGQHFIDAIEALQFNSQDIYNSIANNVNAMSEKDLEAFSKHIHADVNVIKQDLIASKVKITHKLHTVLEKRFYSLKLLGFILTIKREARNISAKSPKEQFMALTNALVAMQPIIEQQYGNQSLENALPQNGPKKVLRAITAMYNLLEKNSEIINSEHQANQLQKMITFYQTRSDNPKKINFYLDNLKKLVEKQQTQFTINVNNNSQPLSLAPTVQYARKALPSHTPAARPVECTLHASSTVPIPPIRERALSMPPSTFFKQTPSTRKNPISFPPSPLPPPSAVPSSTKNSVSSPPPPPSTLPSSPKNLISSFTQKVTLDPMQQIEAKINTLLSKSQPPKEIIIKRQPINGYDINIKKTDSSIETKATISPINPQGEFTIKARKNNLDEDTVLILVNTIIASQDKCPRIDAGSPQEIFKLMEMLISEKKQNPNSVLESIQLGSNLQWNNAERKAFDDLNNQLQFKPKKTS